MVYKIGWIAITTQQSLKIPLFSGRGGAFTEVNQQKGRGQLIVLNLLKILYGCDESGNQVICAKFMPLSINKSSSFGSPFLDFHYTHIYEHSQERTITYLGYFTSFPSPHRL